MRRVFDRAGFDDIPAKGLHVIGGVALGAGDALLSTPVEYLRIAKQAVMQGKARDAVDAKRTVADPS